VKPVLAAESISKSFGHLRVLTAARLSVPAGGITLLAGRNGSGKSTLMRICAGRLAPDQGNVRLDERIWTRAWLHTLARLGVFYMPDRDLLSPARTVRSHMQVLQQRYGENRSIGEVAELLKVTHCLDGKPHEISGGERRRAEIAMALVRTPRCLLADEPLRGIDPADRSVILGALRQLADSGTAVLVSGHEMSDLLDVADQVTWVTSGTTYELGSGTAAMRHERFRREYLTGSWV
jgi:lipopolysaccharide export system ATP-binding protein